MGGDPLFMVEHLNFPELQIEATGLPGHSKASRVPITHHLISIRFLSHVFLSLKLQRG